MTKSEKFVADLCDLSFLPFWSFPSPVGKKGKELCDLLVVCENKIIIISVKDITPSIHEDETIAYKRWVKKAIEDSVSQLYGAESFIQKADTIQLKNSPFPIPLPPKDDRQIHRIAIAFGRKDHYLFPIAHFHKQFVHVFDETATHTLLKELDTITDFTAYLFAKEQILTAVPAIFTNELDFLAHYLNEQLLNHTGKQIEIAEDKPWESLKESKQYKDWRHDIEASYVWDIMIHSFYKDFTGGNLTKVKRDELEAVLRLITLETRMERLALAHAFEETNKTNLKARIFLSSYKRTHCYVFLHLDDQNYATSEQELYLRCMVARTEIPEVPQVVGFSGGRTSDDDFFYNVHYINLPELTEKFIQDARKIKEELGYFKNMKISRK